jgi:hypothetical protein
VARSKSERVVQHRGTRTTPYRWTTTRAGRREPFSACLRSWR